MKVISIKQPYASLIANGYKEYEFRTWKSNYRGEILIHASKGVDKQAMKRFEYLKLEYPLGCIIAKAVMTDCVVIDDKLETELLKKDKNVYAGIIGRKEYGFKLKNVTKIKNVPINGKLGLWNYMEEL